MEADLTLTSALCCPQLATLSRALAAEYVISSTGGLWREEILSPAQRLILFSSNLLPSLKPIMPASKQFKRGINA